MSPEPARDGIGSAGRDRRRSRVGGFLALLLLLAGIAVGVGGFVLRWASSPSGHSGIGGALAGLGSGLGMIGLIAGGALFLVGAVWLVRAVGDE